jgi:beta-phosphoglucomutase-like phosphatase (HAD superfamily)
MPPATEKALLFDIDGTLADTDALHLQAFNEVFGPRGSGKNLDGRGYQRAASECRNAARRT